MNEDLKTALQILRTHLAQPQHLRIELMAQIVIALLLAKLAGDLLSVENDHGG
jgi:hypothetical protein